MSPQLPLIYAELLVNIRQLSVIVAFQTSCPKDASVSLTADGKQFSLRQNGKISVLHLPGQVASIDIQQPLPGVKEFSWRLPLAGPQRVLHAGDAPTIEGPWSARTLTENSVFSCRNCGTVIVGKGAIKEWRDLPSENWAEMMDFWHCHKPADHKHDQVDTTIKSGSTGGLDLERSRGYGASTKFVAQDQVGFVDITSFLLTPKHLSGIKSPRYSEPSTDGHKPRLTELHCAGCNHAIGYNDEQAEGYKIWKWAMAESVGHFEQAETPCSMGRFFSSIISTLLAAVISSQGCSRIVVMPNISTVPSGVQELADHAAPSTTSPYPTTTCSMPSSSPHAIEPFSLSLWILSPSIRYSSNQTASPELSQNLQAEKTPKEGGAAMKVFWKAISLDEAGSMIEKPGVEEVALPMDAVIELQLNLRGSALLLPESGRKFQDWEVGLLDKYEGS
ncbi:hypothetical protein BP5796_04547 [Coleophoma crateriformis]|uniref:Ubiquitin-conjugating enzyme E2-binding protein n=1 Tax=Coleophoma crateriformis TaxID=565419 RepID=A0A3D8S9M7_9HELO|nr:hypothetical protein BP5796_04547 [Coleophoma crateriformis]